MSHPYVMNKCSRTVRSSKFEHNDTSIRNWWNQVFEKLETDFKIPRAHRADVIQQLLPNMYQQLANILHFEESKEVPEREKVPTLLEEDGTGRKYAGSDSASLKTVYDEYEAEGVSCNAGPNNPYMRFFKRRPDRAAIWRTLPPLSLDEMNLTQKAEAITHSIAEDFYEWLKNIGGDDEPTLDATTIMKMFEIGFNCHAATSLCVRIMEMPAVTDPIAEARNLPNASFRVSLHSQLRGDLRAYKTKEKQVAFGKMLPLEMRSMPPKEDFVQKWMDCKRVPSELASMEAVWGGIEGLRSTRAFCGWLIDHPEIPPPLYLEQKGMLNADYLLGPHYSIESAVDQTDLGHAGEAVVATTNAGGKEKEV